MHALEPEARLLNAQVGADGGLDQANGRSLYYKVYKPKGVADDALTGILVAGGGPGHPLQYLENYQYLACHKGRNGQRYKVGYLLDGPRLAFIYT
jgi:hypothetical protein